MTLREEIEELQTCFQRPPSDEAQTREQVIWPLLRSAGYSYRLATLEQRDANRKRPDYTMLPDEPSATWYVEAKAWRVPLGDDQVFQALNYANVAGRRWVVLTNGQEWRLYDNSVQGAATEKLACKHLLSDVDGIQALLEALSPDSVRNGRIAEYAAEELKRREAETLRDRVRGFLENAKRDFHSTEAALLTEAISRNVRGVTPQLVAEVLMEPGEREAALRHIPSPVVQRLTPSAPNPGAWGADRSEIVTFLSTLITSTQGLTIDRVSKRYILFAPASWNQVLPFSSKSTELPAGRAMSFSVEVDVDTPGVTLKLLIHPGPKDFRTRLFYFCKSRPLIRPMRTNPSQKWDMTYRRRFLAGIVLEDLPFERAAKQLLEEWQQFAGGDLKQIEQEVLTLFPTFYR